MKTVRTKWTKGNELKDNGEIGQLDIDGNSITFSIDGNGDPFARNFVGKDNLHNYMVFTYGKKSVASNSTFYHVSKAFLYNGSDYNDFVDERIHGIDSFSFEIVELADWLKLSSVEIFYDNNGNMTIQEKKLNDIVIKGMNPKVFIKYETELPFLTDNDKIEMTLRNAPRVYVEYLEPVNDVVVVDDIRRIMRFFSLLIGRISYAKDIRLNIVGSTLAMWLFVNEDFSHNLVNNVYHLRFRTEVEVVFGKLRDYFEKWYAFAKDIQFSLLQNVFFRINGNSKLSIEDIFLNYCKFLEGYDLRFSKDELKADNLKDQLNEVFRDEGIKELLYPYFKVAGSSSYKSKEIAKWISTGFLGRISLQQRIQRLDERYLGILSANSKDIINNDDTNEFFKRLVGTRNYYSHFKVDDTGIFDFKDMYRTLELLEALIVAILLSEMGMTIEEIKQILIRDERYWVLMIHQR